MREKGAFRACDVRYLPIVSAYARTMGVVEEVDRLCDHANGLSPGGIVLALILDALSGRTPLFRLPQAFAKLDTELLLGEAISPDKLNDDAVGRALDRVYEVGTSKVLSAVAVRVVKLFELDTTHVHHDTTSRTFYGDYGLYDDISDRVRRVCVASLHGLGKLAMKTQYVMPLAASLPRKSAPSPM